MWISAVSGTSAGAMNAAVMAAAHAAGGNAAAREALTNFWQRVAQAATFSPLKRSPIDVLMGRWSLDNSPAYLAFDLMARMFSPFSVENPNHGCSGCSRATSATTSASSPPM